METSLSWRITAPLRSLHRILVGSGNPPDPVESADTLHVDRIEYPPEPPEGGYTSPSPPPAVRSTKKSFSAKWLVVSNCQTIGLAHSLSLLCPSVEVAACDIWQLSKNFSSWQSVLDQYEYVITLPDDQLRGVVDLSRLPRRIKVPAVKFRALHPDITYVKMGDTILKGTMNDYHSALVLAAHRCGLSESQALALFRRDVYEKVGFFSLWDRERETLLGLFESTGFDIRSDFLRWTRRGPFMYSFNHPRIFVLFDIAHHIAKRLYDGTIPQSHILPHDNLAMGSIWPVYPEIAERYGIWEGSYLFKKMGEYTVMDIEQFIAESYQAYGRLDHSRLLIGNPAYQAAIDLIQEGV
ncbi:MAG: hypothetical protein Fur0034_21720 [Desulfuromonadia bacterium]